MINEAFQKMNSGGGYNTFAKEIMKKNFLNKMNAPTSFNYSFQDQGLRRVGSFTIGQNKFRNNFLGPNTFSRKRDPFPIMKKEKSIIPQCLAIHPRTLMKCLRRRMKNLILVDCRFPFEHRNGTIVGSINIYTCDVLKGYFFTKKKRDVIIIFFCEYSSKRGPRMYEMMRTFDRKENENKYPYLHYPQIYVLEGGYRAFYQYNNRKGKVFYFLFLILRIIVNQMLMLQWRINDLSCKEESIGKNLRGP